MPALATTTSIAPRRASISATILSACRVERTSKAMNSAEPPLASASWAALEPSVSRMSVTTTWSPAAAKASAVARPMPMPPPVIRIVLWLMPRPSQHHVAGIRPERLTDEKARFIGGEERHGGGDLFRLAEPAERQLRRLAPPPILRQSHDERRFDRAWRDRVDAHAMRAELARQRLGQADDRGLGRSEERRV